MGWPVKKLSDICTDIFAGGDVPKDRLSKFRTKQYSIPIYANGEKNKGLYGYTDVARVVEPCITVSARGTIGYSEVRYEPFLPVVRLIVLIPNPELIYLEYLKYVLKGMNFGNSGTSIPQLTVPMIKNYKCELPSIEEQKRIVAILDQAFADIDKARALTEQNLKNARELFDSYLQQVFSQRADGWEKQKFGEVCKFVRGPFGGALKKNIFKPSGFAVYEQQHAINNQFEEIRYFIDEDKFREMARFELFPGDLIMSCSGTMGKIAIVPGGIRKGIINQALLKLTPQKSIDSDFLKIWMQSPNFQQEIESLAQGVAIRNMASVKILKEINMPLPSINEQREIVKIHNTIDSQTKKLVELNQTKLIALDELKKSLLQKAFSGELTKDNQEAA